MLREIICQIRLPRPPINFKLTLCFTVAKPMESHVHCFGAFRLYFFVDPFVSAFAVEGDPSRSGFVENTRLPSR
jgi:hypothetical protein